MVITIEKDKSSPRQRGAGLDILLVNINSFTENHPVGSLCNEDGSGQKYHHSIIKLESRQKQEHFPNHENELTSS